MNCEMCGREMRPAPARFDGEDTFVGFFPCVCSRTAWLNCGCREYGSTYEEHLEHCAKVQTATGIPLATKKELRLIDVDCVRQVGGVA